MFLKMLFLGLCFHSSYSSSPGMGGINLLFTTYNSPPYSIILRGPDGNYTNVGSLGKIFYWLSQKLNFTITLLPILDDSVRSGIGVIEAATQKMMNKEVDGVLGFIVITPDRTQWSDYTCGILWSEPYNLIVPRPVYESRFFAFIRPFQPEVWLFLALCGIIFVGMMSYFSWLYQQNENDFKISESINKSSSFINRISFYTVYVVNIITNHGAYTSYSQHSFRILVGSWLLSALVLVNSYSSIVVSCLTLPPLKPAINSFEDLASSPEVSMISMRSVVLTQTILNATSGTYLKLGNQLRQHPERMFVKNTLAFKMLEEGKYSLPWINSFNYNFVATQFHKDGKCRFQLSDPLPVTHFTSAIGMKKGFKFTSLLSRELIVLWETGLSLYWMRNPSSHADQCFEKNPPKSATAVPIKLVDLTSAYILLGIGVGLSILSFLIELSAFKPSHRKSQVK